MRTTFIPLLFVTCFVTATLTYAQPENQPVTYLINSNQSNEDLLEAYNKLFKQLEFANNDSLIYYLQNGLKEFEQRKYVKGEASLLTLLGSAYSIKGMQPLAKAQLTSALDLFKTLGDKNSMGAAHNTLGIIEGKTGNYEAALHHFFTALKLFEQTGNKDGISNTYVKLGVAYELNGDLNKGLSYYQKALALLKNKPVSGNLITLHNNIGSLYCRKKEYKAAIPYFEKAMELTSVPAFKQMRAFPLSNLGQVYINLGDKEKGREYLVKALETAQQDGLSDQEAHVLLSLSEITADKELALSYLNKAWEIAKNNGEKRLQADVLEVMTGFYKGNKDYQKALEVYEKSRAIQDSIFTIEKEKEIANLQSVYELEKSHTKIGELEVANKKNTYFRNIIIGIAAVLALLLLLTFLFLWRIRSLNIKLLQSEQALKKANEDKDRLFSVIGHDLRNHVANVPIVLDMYEDETLTREEKKFLLDSLKDNAIATRDTLEKLLNWGKSQLKGITAIPTAFNAKEKIANKLRLMKTASEQKQISIKAHVAEDINVYADEEHFKFVIRNLLSNAIKYTHHGGAIEINAKKEAGDIIFSVKDNGMGMTQAQQEHIFEPFNMSLEGTDHEKGNGIGLMLCKEFISKNSGRIWVESEIDKGTTFFFSLKEAHTTA